MNPYVIPGLTKPIQLYTPEEIAERTCRFFGIPVQEIFTGNRTRKITEGRHATMWILHKVKGMKVTHVGKFFGRDHTTVLNAIKMVNDRLDVYEDYRKQMETLIDIFNHSDVVKPFGVYTNISGRMVVMEKLNHL